MGLKILGRIGTHGFYGWGGGSGKNMIVCILKGISPFRMHEIIFRIHQKKFLLDLTNCMAYWLLTDLPGKVVLDEERTRVDSELFCCVPWLPSGAFLSALVHHLLGYLLQ